MTFKIQGNLALIAAALASGMFTFFTFIGLITALLVDLSKEFGTTVAAIGQLTTITAVSWALLALLIGPLSDRVGHKRVVVVGLAILGVSLFGYGVSNSLWMLIVVSILAGLGGAMVGPNILACVGEYYSASIHGRMMAVVNTATPIANLVGVPLAVLIAGNLGWRWSFQVLALFLLTSVLSVIVVLPPPRPHQSDGAMAYLSSFREAFREKTFLPIVMANTALQAAFWVVATYLPAFLILSYILSTSQLAPLLSAMAAGQLVGTLAGGPLADRFNRIMICAVMGALLGMMGLTFILFTSNVWLSVFLGGLFMGLHASSRPAFFSLMVLVSNTVRGTVMGIQATSNHLGRALGAAVGGLVLSLAGYGYLGVLCLILGLVASAMYVFVALFLRKAPKGTTTG